jgi:hypothetical protein
MGQWRGGPGLYSTYASPNWTQYYDATPNTSAYNIATGYKALYKSMSGSYNIAQGYEALYNNTSGFHNIATGYQALYNNQSGYWNVAQGINALIANITGTENTAQGAFALENNTGSKNTGIGKTAGSTATTGSNNTYLGYMAQPASVTDSNQITLGDSNITHLRCQVTSITALSDARDKTGIQDSVYGLDFINKLRPVTFEWNMRDGGKAGQKDLGFLAQDFVELEDELDAHEILNLTMRSNPDKLEASYGRLVPILVKAVQDLSAEVQSLKQLLQSKD